MLCLFTDPTIKFTLLLLIIQIHHIIYINKQFYHYPLAENPKHPREQCGGKRNTGLNTYGSDREVLPSATKACRRAEATDIIVRRTATFRNQEFPDLILRFGADEFNPTGMS